MRKNQSKTGIVGRTLKADIYTYIKVRFVHGCLYPNRYLPTQAEGPDPRPRAFDLAVCFVFCVGNL